MKRERKMQEDGEEADYDLHGYGHRGKIMKTGNGRILHHDHNARDHPVSILIRRSDQNEDTEMDEAEEREITHTSDQESFREPQKEVPVKLYILPKQKHKDQCFEEIFKIFLEIDIFIATALQAYRCCLEVHDGIIKGRINVLEGPLQIEEHFKPSHIWCIKLIFKDHSHLVLDRMSKNPTTILPVVMKILKKKYKECLMYRSENRKDWAQIYAAILCKLLGDIIQESDQESIVQEPGKEEGEGFKDQNENDCSDSVNKTCCISGQSLLIFPNGKQRNYQHHQEAMMKIILEIDFVIEILLQSYERCFQVHDSITEGRINFREGPLQIEQHFMGIHLWCFKQIHRECDLQVLESVRENPIMALPDIMRTLKMVYEEFCLLRSEGRKYFQGLYVCLDLLALDL